VGLIDDGIRQHPEHWRFYLDKGFLYYWYLRDYKKAAEIFLEGSELEGAPFWMRTTAGRALAQGGDRQTARGLWQMLHDTADPPQQRDNAAIHMMQLDALISWTLSVGSPACSKSERAAIPRAGPSWFPRAS
jgi:hypothetical protein